MTEKEKVEKEKANLIGFVIGFVMVIPFLVVLGFDVYSYEKERNTAIEKIESEFGYAPEDVFIEDIASDTLRVKTLEGNYIIEIEGSDINKIYREQE